MKNNEFQKMCEKAGIKKEALADTVFTRQFKGIDKEYKETREKIQANTRALIKGWKKDDMLKSLDRYKMNEKDFNLWLKYLATHPRKPDYIDFRKFKERKGDIGKMKLMTKEIEKKLIKMGSQEDSNPRIIVKFFCPWNQWTWYVLEGKKLPNGDWRFYGLVDGLEKELGYFTLEELESLRKGNHPNGLKVERDKWFGFEHRLSEFQEQKPDHYHRDLCFRDEDVYSSEQY